MEMVYSVFMVKHFILRETVAGLRNLRWFCDDRGWGGSKFLVSKAYNHFFNILLENVNK